MPVIEIHSDAEYPTQVAAAGGKPIVVDFTASWCGPCKMIAPVFAALSNTYLEVVFLKVDVDQCPGTAASNGVSAMPTFIMLNNGQKVDSVRGANAQAIEDMIKKFASVTPVAKVNGHSDLTSLIDKQQLELLNGDDEISLERFLDGNCDIISDCDEQLILYLPFNQPVKVHSIQLKGKGDKTPKRVKVFINVPKTLDFDNASAAEAVQVLDFDETAQTSEGQLIQLKYVKFQNVKNIQLFIENNQGGGEVTELTDLKLYGTPISGVNMKDFKRVAGKEGEVGH